MTRAEQTLMKQLEGELNRGCSSGFRLPDSERDRLSMLYPKIRVISAADDEFLRRVYWFDHRKVKRAK